MSSASRLQVGRVRPDGTRPVTGVDAAGLRLRGEVGPEPTGFGATARVLSADEVARLATIAARAPSVHNTQPWKFRASDGAIELLADPARQLLQADPAGREMLISCGAALFGLRLGLRSLGCVPAVDVLPDPGQPDLIARARVAGQVAITRYETDLLAALYHRHTHRGPFVPGDVPSRLLDGLRADAVAEQTELIVLADPVRVSWLTELVLAAAREQAASPQFGAELSTWTRAVGSRACDGVPASARVEEAVNSFASPTAPQASLRLPQRDFGEPGTEPAGGAPPPVTVVLTTASDLPADWVHAGQALHRMLLHAAARWVFGSLQSQPLELPALRADLCQHLGLAGAPQMLLQFGRANIARATPRRPAAEIIA